MDCIIVINTVLALTLKIINIVIHSIGLYLLRSLQRNGRGDENMIYLTSLSVSELLMNIVSFARNLLKMIPHEIFKSDLFNKIVMYSYIGDYTVLKLTLFMTMVIMSLDRMFLVLLNISYPLLWSRKKAKICIWFVWGVSVGLFAVSSLLYSQADSTLPTIQQPNNTINSTVSRNITQSANSTVTALKKFENEFFLLANYTVIFLNLTFVVTAIVSYGLIFHIFKRTHGSCDKGVWEVFKKSRFYVPLLIILSNILFILPPDFVWTFVKDPDKVVQLFTTTSYAVAYLSDGLLYIFMNDKVRKRFWKRVRKIAHNHNNSECALVRNLAILVERNIPVAERGSVFSHSENASLFHENVNASKDRSPRHHKGSVATSLSSIEMYAVGASVS